MGGAALGMLTCGWVVGYLQTLEGWDDIQAYRTVFFAYAVVGLVKLALAMALSEKIEAEKELPKPADAEEAPLLGGGGVQAKKKKSFFLSLFPHISPESRIILTQLSLLYALDSLGGGLAPL